MIDTQAVAPQSENSDATKNNNLRIFTNSSFGKIRTIDRDGETWFIAKDVADILNYEKSSKMYKRLDEDECSETKLQIGASWQKAVIINESGLYNAIIGSTKPEAKQFKKWITSEVLPSIRKHGVYATEITVDKMLNDPDFAISLLTKLKEEKALRIKAQEEKAILVHTNKTYTATEIAKEVGVSSAIKFNKMLECRKIQYSVNGTWVLCAKYAKCAYTSIKQTELESGKIVYDRRFTGMGREFILSLNLLGDGE